MYQLAKKLLVVILLFLLVGCSKKEDKKDLNDKIDQKQEQDIVYHAPLTGMEVNRDISKERAFSVMLDNHPDALPQSGLNDSDILYEFKAEGEFTRYMAIFQSKIPDVIGPVRSARPYFAQTALEYNSIYCHFGGSEAGYAEIKNIGLDDLDGIALDGSTYYRNKEVGKKRPHDAYTSKENIIEQSKAYKYDLTSENNEFKFDEGLSEQMGDVICDELSLNFFDHYNEKYIFDNGSYKILRNGQAVTDERDDSEYRPNNIIILFQSSKVAGPLSTLKIDNIGAGAGLLLSEGKIIDIEWKKEDKNSKTKFYKKSSNSEIVLKSGKTFIAVCDPTDKITISPSIESNESK